METTKDEFMLACDVSCLIYDAKTLLTIANDKLHSSGINEEKIDHTCAYGLHLILEDAIQKLNLASTKL